DDARAIEAFTRLSEDPHARPEASALLAEIYAKSNRMSEARSKLAYASAHARDVDPADLAVAMAAVGQRHLALSLLRRQQAEPYLRAEIASDPRFSVLRNDPQLAELQKPA